jgi:hypothetical protein
MHGGTLRENGMTDHRQMLQKEKNPNRRVF